MIESNVSAASANSLVSGTEMTGRRDRQRRHVCRERTRLRPARTPRLGELDSQVAEATDADNGYVVGGLAKRQSPARRTHRSHHAQPSAAASVPVDVHCSDRRSVGGVQGSRRFCDEFHALVEGVAGEQEAERYAATLPTGAQGAPARSPPACSARTNGTPPPTTASPFCQESTIGRNWQVRCGAS